METRHPTGRLEYKEAEQMLRAGKTQQEVADRYGVTQAAVSMAISRGMINVPKTQHRGGMPWSPIRPEHRNRFLAQMLRAAYRREQGEVSNEVVEHRLDRFLADMEERNFVVHYDPDTEEGFFRVPRRPGEEGLVRMPE